MQVLLLPLIVFLTVLTLAVVLLGRHDEISQQQVILSRMSQPISEDPEGEVDITRAVPVRPSALFGNLLSKMRLLKRLEESLWQAGMYLNAPDVAGLMLALGASAAAAWAVFSGGINFTAFVVGLGAGCSPLLYILWRKNRRLRAFDQQLPEMLDMMKASLDAGHTLQRALQVTVEEFPDPASGEFRVVLEQNRLGVPLARALEYMLARVPDENLRFLVVAIKIQSDVGSSLAGIVGQLAKTIRDRQRVDMQVRVLTTQPRVGAIIAGLMPLLLLLGLSFINPPAVKMLFHDPTGIKLMKTAAVFEIVALITVYRMVRVDY